MFQRLSHVQRGESVPLQQYIDNRGGGLRVGLRSITYTVGWFNVQEGEMLRLFEYPFDRDSYKNIHIPGGLYGSTDLLKIIHDFTDGKVVVEINPVNGVITLTVQEEAIPQFSDGLLTLLGLDDGLGGQLLSAGTYTGDRPVNFTNTKDLHIHLEQINTTSNFVDGAPSNLLTTVGLGLHKFGDIDTTRINHPEFKRLQDGIVNELKVTITDEIGNVIDNHNLPIHVTLEIK